MNTQYKSSKFATSAQYIATPIIISIFLFQIYYFFIAGNFIDVESLFMLPFWFWASIVVTINIFKLRDIKVTENGILMKSLNNEEILEYKDIIWINQNIFGSNWYIVSIKYRDNISGKTKVIFALPEMYTDREGWSIFNPIRELNMVKYIREQIYKINPSYQIKNEPSRWSLFLIMIISLIPFILASFYLISIFK